MHTNYLTCFDIIETIIIQSYFFHFKLFLEYFSIFNIDYRKLKFENIFYLQIIYINIYR